MHTQLHVLARILGRSRATTTTPSVARRVGRQQKSRRMTKEVPVIYGCVWGLVTHTHTHMHMHMHTHTHIEKERERETHTFYEEAAADARSGLGDEVEGLCE